MLDYLESKTFEVLLENMLAAIPDDIDKREGSVIYDALAPTAMALAETYHDMSVLYRRTFAATADGEDLEKRVSEHGVDRKAASYALRKGLFVDTNGDSLEVPIGSVYRNNGINYAVESYIEPGAYALRSLIAGTEGNQHFGILLPIEANNELGSATLAEVLIPGEDSESDESLYAKYKEHIQNKRFGGNRADYRSFIKDIQGVGGVRLKRAPLGGGTVAAYIIDSDFNSPSNEFVAYVQNIVDPIEAQGEGKGTAPMCHEVTVYGADTFGITVSCDLVLNGVSIGQVESQIEDVINEYFRSLRANWVQELPVTVRIAQISSKLLEIEGIEDVQDVLLNSATDNIQLDEAIPVLAEIIINEVV